MTSRPILSRARALAASVSARLAARAIALRVLAWALLATAWLLFPLSLLTPGFNGLSLLGVLAAVASIALFVSAPSTKESRP